MFDHRYPGTDLHEIDLAYILGEIQALKAKLDNYVKENTFHLADPLDWNITSQYSACTIVRYSDDRLYLSAKPVPAGIQITNTEYWLNLIDCSGGGGGDYQEREVSFIPTETQQILDVYPETGYDALSKVRVIVQAISNLFVGSGIPRRNSSDMTASGAQVTAPAGYYANNGIKSVQSGSEGTPIATKGTVNNHSIDVTPSVTNAEGYIAGGTKTGSAVSVTASELDSGTKSIVANGTGIDVVGYAAVDVAVPGSVPTLQTKSATFTPTESTQTQAVTADQGYDALSEVDITVNPIPSQYIVPTGTKSITENGTGIDVSAFAAVDVNVSGGGSYEDAILQRELTGSYTNSTITKLSNALCYQTQVASINLPNLTRGIVNELFRGCSNLTTLYVPKLSSSIGNANYAFAETKLVNFALPGWTTGIGNRLFNNCSSLAIVDMAVNGFGGDVFYGCQNLHTLILRRTASLVNISNATFGSSPFASGGTGGTIYIPKVFYDALGTGTNDYKAAANWSTIDGYGTITWACIEGSQYENYYADGTPVT